ncbi:hypothetical protein ACFSTC_38020 [Nonomuraea ferruginea]
MPQVFQNVGKTVREGAPKTESSDAIIALDRGALKALRAHRERQLQEGEAFGASWTDTGRTFTWEDGSKLKPDRVSEHFRRLVFAAGLPPSGCTTCGMERPRCRWRQGTT